MMQSILRVTGTYMVIKILSIHYAHTSVINHSFICLPPPSSKLFQVQLFVLLSGPAAAGAPPLGKRDWPRSV